VLTCQKEVVVLGNSAPHSLPFVQPKNILQYSVKSTSIYLPKYGTPIPILDAMHLLHMHHHLILPRKPPMPSTLTATTLLHRTPKHRLLEGMSSIVVAMEVGPAAKGFGATSGKGAAEDEDARIRCWLDGADVRCRWGVRDRRQRRGDSRGGMMEGCL
jgi:hypothetical protein